MLQPSDDDEIIAASLPDYTLSGGGTNVPLAMKYELAKVGLA